MNSLLVMIAICLIAVSTDIIDWIFDKWMK